LLTAPVVFRISAIQKLKANHNLPLWLASLPWVFRISAIQKLKANHNKLIV